MDKNSIKRYAVWARRELISRVSQRAAMYEITADGYGDQNANSVNGIVLSQNEKKQRIALIGKIQEKGYEQVIEEVAYTWFNRFSALRFMEVNGYLPSHVRVFTNEDNSFKPQILSEAINMELDGLNLQKVYDYKEADNEDELFKYLLITQCNALSKILPGMFQKISDYTELLFPDNLLREGSVIEQMISMIPQDDWLDQVQVIGWLYQYYNTELNELVYDGTLKKAKLNKELVPAATTIYTPDWVVEYMVENSLGKIWIKNRLNNTLKNRWKYYIDDVETDEDVQESSADTSMYNTINPEDIRCIDPCSGSGHILCVLFDVLVTIYEDFGYSAREAVASIVKRNIWGLDIDDRAAQITYFSMMMKARQYDKRFFTRNIQPHTISFIETNNIKDIYLPLVEEKSLSEKSKTILNYLMDAFIDAKEYGSALLLKENDYDQLQKEWEQKKSDQKQGNMTIWEYSLDSDIARIIEQSIVLTQKYDVVVTNPPYLSNGRMNGKLNKYVSSRYPEVKYDLSTVIYKTALDNLCKEDGYVAFITTKSWMFLSNFESFRRDHIQRVTFSSILDLGTELFDGKVGHNHIVSWVVQNSVSKTKGVGIRLSQFCYSAKDKKEPEFFNVQHRYTFHQDLFSKIPGNPIAYWVSDSFIKAFSNGVLGDRYITKKGMFTGNNDLFLRYWYEVDYEQIGESYRIYNKGGGYRRWYGNGLYVIRWKNNGYDVKNYEGSGNINEDFFYKECLTWNLVTLAPFCCRYLPQGQVMGDAGPTCLCNDKNMYYVLGYMNTCVANLFMSVLNPTMNYPTGVIDRLPLKIIPDGHDIISNLAKDNVTIAKADWDSFETSMGFTTHPLLYGKHPLNCTNGKRSAYISKDFELWQELSDERFLKMKENEEEINKFFIDALDLSEELNCSVNEESITLSRVDVQREIRSFISYAVGCMFGRYSIDYSGIAFAGGLWDPEKYISFQPDGDAIIPICDDEYFEDDIVGRFIEFLRVVYGGETIEENLRFISGAIGGKGSPRDVIRNYFINDFYSDHLRIYQKRPIYWLFDSGKKNGFKCLIYMHRYQSDTIARIRTDYVHEQQARYRTIISDLENQMASAGTGERVKLTKKLDGVKAKAEELRIFEEKIHHLADQMIRIDLDDGVKVNYAKFQDVLAKIK